MNQRAMKPETHLLIAGGPRLPFAPQTLSRLLRAAAAFALGGWLTAASVCAQGTGFTYQGRLNDGANPASGSYDFTFSVWNAATGPSQLGSTLTRPATAVSNGLFTVTLDFGSGLFPGADRWLEIAVRTNGAPVFTTLNQRQKFSATPYAITAGNVTGPVPASQVTGSIALGQLPAAVVTNGASGVNISGTFTGNGAGLSNLPAASLPSGVTLVSADAQDAAFLAAGMQRFLSVPAPAWVNGTTLDAPASRTEHTAIWTGQELLVWGGNIGSGYEVGTGSGYAPDGDQWNAISTVDAPAARRRHGGVWSGQELIVWGGVSSGAFANTGGKYNPATLLWSPTATLNAPAGRSDHIAVWTGARLIVWGGRDGGGLFNDGALYHPASNQWTNLSLPSPPDARMNAAAVWAGDRLVVWGGQGDAVELSTGGRLLVSGGTNATQWLATSAVNAPSPRRGHSMVWTGSRVIVWGGRTAGTPLADGGIYDPVADSWQTLSAATNLLSARSGHVAVWTGSEMLVWSGETAGGASASGAAYHPATGQWRALTASGGAIARTEAVACWSGTELVVFGGRSGASPVGSLQRLNPQPAWHFFRKP